MFRFLAPLAVGLALSLSALAQPTGEIKVLIAIDPSDSEGLLINPTAIAATLGNAVGRPVRITKSDDLGNAMRATRTGEFDVYIAPAHVAASALNHGYDIVGATARDEPYILMTRPGVGAAADLKGTKIYLTQQDSVATYVARGMLNESGQSLRLFQDVMYRKTTGAGLFALTSGIVDATVAKRSDVEAWTQQNPGKGKALLTSKAVPGGMSVAIKRSLPDAQRARLVAWFESPGSVIPGIGRVAFKPDGASYEYVAGLGLFTPGQLPGATRVNVAEVDDLIRKGVTFVDVRSEKEYKERHVKGAIWIPYAEKSLKDVAFDPAADAFSGIDKLDPAKPVIFACNGADCWKSYKASKVALAKGFKSVYWFRGGLPEWLARGMPVDGGA
ncbi:MAG: PhnD/SsuA/transferrin family substrate-binding protein [Burkholderiales bacterium]|nr:PhnD/SsuA/transferrin family substrate-binding protein [Burkholderiales bacterium]